MEHPIGTYLYGRRIYETMIAWEHAESFAGEQQVMQDYAYERRFRGGVMYVRYRLTHRSRQTRAHAASIPQCTVGGQGP